MSFSKALCKAGNTAVVTGASSGIGRAACKDFAAAGMHVWMVDIDKDELTAARDVVVQAAGGGGDAASASRIRSECVDVANAEAMMELAAKIFDTATTPPGTGACHVLMNNAGTGLGGGALSSLETMQKVVNVNTYGPIHGCLAFVPKMKASGEPGIVINTGSKQGITMPPGNLAYNVSKAALKCYTEGLEHELRQERAAGTGNLRAALLVPGWVNTEIVRKTLRAQQQGSSSDAAAPVPFCEENPAAGAWMPSRVIEFLKQELDLDRFYVICPDNDVDRATDNARMQWTVGDIVNDRPPLSRWHPDYADQFKDFLSKQLAEGQQK